MGDGYLCPNSTFSLHCHHQTDCIKAGSCVRHFNVSLIVWLSHDSVHKPQILKRNESRSGSNRGPSAYQHSVLPLGHNGSQGFRTEKHVSISRQKCSAAPPLASNHQQPHVTIKIPHENLEDWPPYFPHKLTHSSKAKDW